MKIKSFHDDIESSLFGPHRTWVVAGKGRSYSALVAAKTRLPIVSLNHACLHITPTFAHFVDIEALVECQERLLSDDSICVVVPWEMNESFQRCGQSLDWLAYRFKVIEALADKSRLYGYSRSGSVIHRRHEPAIDIHYGSAEGAIGLLSHYGVKHFVLAGVEGGTEYAPEFQHLKPMQNGRTFDDQWGELLKLRDRKGLTFSRIVP